MLWALVGLALLVVVGHRVLSEGPWSFHARYLRDVEAGLLRSVDAPLITEFDLAALPEPVRRYLRLTRAVGQPRVTNYRVRFTGRIRSAPDAAWMPFHADQQSFVRAPTRISDAGRMFGVPVEAFHRRSTGTRRCGQVASRCRYERAATGWIARRPRPSQRHVHRSGAGRADIAWEQVGASCAPAPSRPHHHGHSVLGGRLARELRVRRRAIVAGGIREAGFSTPARLSNFGRSVSPGRRRSGNCPGVGSPRRVHDGE